MSARRNATERPSTRRRRLRWMALGAMIGVVVVGLGACSSSSGTSGGSGGGTFVMSYQTNNGANYDPQASQTGLNVFMSPVFETLMTKDDSGNVKPLLATKWAVSANNTVLTLTLRSGVKFQDGEPFDASAVKFSLNRGLTSKTSAIKGALAGITSITVANPTTVSLTLAKGGAQRMVSTLATTAGVMVPPKAVDKPTFKTNPVGTGPWMVDAASDPTSEMIYDAFPGYWDKPVQKVKKIEIKVLNQQAALNALLDGSIDFLPSVADAATANTAKKAGMVNVNASKTMNLHVFQLNKKSGSLFSNQNLRLALAYALDRKSLVDNVYDQFSSYKCEITSQPFTSANPFYDSSLPPIQYDPTKAKQYLAAGGKPNGFSFTVTASSSTASFGVALTAIKQQLAKVGIEMNIVLQPLTAVNAGWLAGKYDALYQTAILQTPAEYTSPANLGTVDDPVMDSALAAANNAPDPAAQVKDTRIWSDEFQKQAYSVTICNLPVSGWARPNVHGLAFPSVATGLSYQGISFKNVSVG